MITDLLLKYHALVDAIMEYESDTFTASGMFLKKKEAKQIARKLVIEDIQKRLDGDTLDGIIISELLSEIRGDDNDDAS